MKSNENAVIGQSLTDPTPKQQYDYNVNEQNKFDLEQIEGCEGDKSMIDYWSSSRI